MKKITGIQSILVHACLIVCACFLLIFLINGSLKLFTLHGKEITVPDFTNMTIEEARTAADEAGVKVSVGASTYKPQMRKGAVYNQDPKAGASVKRGRVVILTTNTQTPKMKSMPSLIDHQLSQAKSQLDHDGLILGRLIFEEREDDLVFGQFHRGRSIKPGTEILEGSTIDLKVGYTPQTSRVTAPNLKGKRYLHALESIHEHSFNVGNVKFDSTVKTYIDSLNAVVISQKPAADGKAYGKGKEMSIELSLDPEKISK